MAISMGDALSNSFSIPEQDYVHCLCHPEYCVLDFSGSQDSSNNDSLSSEFPVYDDVSFQELFDQLCLTSREPYEIVSYEGRVALIIVYTLTIVLTLAGNITVLFVLAFRGLKKTELNKYLINLAVSDLCVAIFCMPFSFVQAMLRRWIFSPFMCPLMYFVQQVSVFVSISTLTVVGIGRCIAVRKPIESRMSKSKSKYVIPSLWLMSMGLGSVQLIKARAVLQDEVTGDQFYQCDEWWDEPKDAFVYEIFIIVAAYFIPLVILCGTYCVTGNIIWKRQTLSEEKKDSISVKSKKKVTRMLVVVVSAFAFCWLPLNLFNIITMANTEYLDNTDYHQTTVTLYLFSHWLAMSNSFLNPIIYTFLNDSFRAELNLVFTGVRRRQISSSVTHKLSLSGLSKSRRSFSGNKQLSIPTADAKKIIIPLETE
ncbi:QRFP-like peptide receptor [Saccoglossus kowalevskii]|uniref:Neuromedin-K receptor-like n=1 Tax=Saccoglossus kowalevskii TaxID=10224 RepID=A0ABM0GJ15_SACKO|nr:PREDICTED: neuromedin-K receptor-like [Saccoglossus kowalevskii]